jgi:hypothetical protein
VVLPASGWEMMANVRRATASASISPLSDIRSAYGQDRRVPVTP